MFVLPLLCGHRPLCMHAFQTIPASNRQSFPRLRMDQNCGCSCLEVSNENLALVGVAFVSFCCSEEESVKAHCRTNANQKVSDFVCVRLMNGVAVSRVARCVCRLSALCHLTSQHLLPMTFLIRPAARPVRWFRLGRLTTPRAVLPPLSW